MLFRLVYNCIKEKNTVTFIFKLGLIILKIGKVSLPSATRFRNASTFEINFKQAIKEMIENFYRNYSDHSEYENFEKTLVRILNFNPIDRPDFIELFHEIINLKDLENLKMHILIEDCKEKTLELFMQPRSKIYQNSNHIESKLLIYQIKIILDYENGYEFLSKSFEKVNLKKKI